MEPRIQNQSFLSQFKEEGQILECGPFTVDHWLPHAFNWLVALPYLIYLTRKKTTPRNNAYRVVYTVRVVLGVLTLVTLLVETLILLSTRYPISSKHDVDVAQVSAVCVNFISQVLATMMMVMELRRGFHPSVIPAVFWFGLMSSKIGVLQVVVLEVNDRQIVTQPSSAICISHVIMTSTVFMYCFIVDFCIRTRAFLHTSSEMFKALKTKKIDPYFWTAVISKILFLYTLRDMWMANKRQITMEDLNEYQPGDGAKDKLKQVQEELARRSSTKGQNQVLTLQKLLFITLRLVMGPSIIFFIIKIFNVGIMFAMLISLRQLIAFMESPDTDNTWGLLLVFRFSFVRLVHDICYSPWFYVTHYSGAQMRGLLSAMLIQKYTNMPGGRRRQAGADIDSFITVDVHRIAETFSGANHGLDIFLYIIPGFILLVNLLGPSGVLGIIFIFFVLCIHMLIFKKVLRPLMSKEMEAKDQRVKLMQSILRGIKILKSNTWEKPYKERVMEKRRKEISYLKRIYIMQGISGSLSMVSPYVATCLMTVTYVLSSAQNEVTAERIFTVMALIHVLAARSLHIPGALYHIAQGYVSMKRVFKFFQTSTDMEHTEEEEQILCPTEALRMEEASFGWDSVTPVLKGINLVVQKGELVAVVGKVGSGKSSLLSSILGELNLLSGHVTHQKSIAYTSQTPWTFCGTIKENIVFGGIYDENKYVKVIKACALEVDFESMPDKDLSEIGEHSATLSGGQKHRINLARAVYADKDLYLLDDPLSAVDAKVAAKLFDEVIGPKGILKEKTRILVTHSIQWLHMVDQIVVINDGKITTTGTYADLIKSNCHLVKYLQQVQISADDEVQEHSALHSGIGKYKNQDSKYVDDLTVSYESVSLQTLIVYMKAGGIWLTAFIFILTFAITGMQVEINIWLSYWSADWRINATSAVELSQYRLGVFVALGCAQGVLVLLCAWCLAVLILNAAKSLHQQLLDKTLQTEITCFDYIPSGIILNCFTKDTDNIDTGLLIPLWWLMYRLTYAMGSSIFILVTFPMAIVSNIVAIILAIIASVGFNRYGTQIIAFDGAVRSPLFSCMNEVIKGVVSIRTYGRLTHFCNRFYQLCDKSTSTFWNFIALKRLITALGFIVFNFVSLIVNLICLYKRFELNPSVTAACVYVVAQSIYEVSLIVQSICQLAYTLVSVERVSSTNYLQPEEPWHIPETAPPQDWPSHGEISFVDFSAKYQTSNELVLSNLTFNIKHNEKIGIVGRTGAGKSSLAAALLRIVTPVRGKIEIDGLNINTLGLHDLRSRITLITQDPILFEGSIRRNIDPFNEHGDEQIWTVLEKVHLKGAIQSMPKTLFSECGDNEGIFSTGQKQLLCLARALLRKSRILILDEPTASVDVHTDHLLQETLRLHLHNCTLITIAHRIRTVLTYDRIMVLDGGQVAEFDTPANLLRNPTSLFHSLGKKSGIMSYQDS